MARRRSPARASHHRDEPAAAPDVLWSPADDVLERSQMGRYLRWLETDHGLAFPGYEPLWRWSVDDPGAFWLSVWDWFRVRGTIPHTHSHGGTPGGRLALADARMPGAQWFPGVRLNYAENALALPGRSGTDVVVVARSQTRAPLELTADELRDAVARCRAGLVRLGVRHGDRVAALLPNIPEALIAMLATASLGATWSACSPEFGARAVLDRFAQIGPAMLLAVDGYRYGDRPIDRAAEVAALRAALPTLRASVLVPYLRAEADAVAAVPDCVPWSSLLAESAPLAFDPVPFAHPLWVLYSSGTTGLPKPIVHGHGGILLEHQKALALHTDLGPTDRFCWFTTTGWMMWNYLVAGLAVGATVVLVDGNPAWPDLGAPWRLAAETRTTYLGVSAPLLMACRGAGLAPGRELDLSALRGVGSTGAPLTAAGFHWVAEAVSDAIPTGSLSGGTDLCTGFLGPSPLVPVWAGEISCRMLGARVEAWDGAGRPVLGRQGELVITAPMPSMPVALWGDADGSRMRASYFEPWPGTWRHGDWLTITERGSCVITGRSDATLNRGGVRIGTAELYAVLEAMPEVADSLAVHLEDETGGPGDLLLFLVLEERATLDDALRARVVAELRTALSPRHVPDEILVVPAIPRTLSGKKLEVPVKRILQGAEPDLAVSRDALADPRSLEPFEALAKQRGRGG